MLDPFPETCFFGLSSRLDFNFFLPLLFVRLSHYRSLKSALPVCDPVPLSAPSNPSKTKVSDWRHCPLPLKKLKTEKGSSPVVDFETVTEEDAKEFEAQKNADPPPLEGVTFAWSQNGKRLLVCKGQNPRHNVIKDSFDTPMIR